MTPRGHIHVISQTIERLAAIFSSMGFAVIDGPHVESEYYNFDALNIPADHPARDLWDTFWLKPESSRKLLRTHTSPVQVRYTEEHKPPLRIIVPGKTFRYEATDATHEAQFFQVEGLVVGNGIGLAHLKGTLAEFFKQFYGTKTAVRLRPSYFPFVEPGVEVDISCFRCGEKGQIDCPVCKGTGWLEIMGAGVVHPTVLQNGGIDPAEFSGFAFGAGIERLIMLKHGVDDIRLFHNGDLRFVNQF